MLFGRKKDQPESTPPPPVSRALLRFEVPGRCPSGSFSPDGTQLAVASGFQRTNNVANGEVGVFSTANGVYMYRHEFDAYYVQVVHSDNGVFVADWQLRGNQLEPGVVARYTAVGREVLVGEAGINPFVGTPRGFAALTYEGDLLLGLAGDIARPPKPGPMVCLACDPVSGWLAAGGDRLVLMDEDGRTIAVAAVPAELHQVAFLGPDRLVTMDATTVYLWRYRNGSLTALANATGMQGMSRLAALPEHGVIIGASRRLTSITMARVHADTIQVVPAPAQLHGSDIWVAPNGKLIAVPGPFNEWLPPAPEQVEIFRTDALF